MCLHDGVEKQSRIAPVIVAGLDRQLHVVGLARHTQLGSPGIAAGLARLVVVVVVVVIVVPQPIWQNARWGAPDTF